MSSKVKPVPLEELEEMTTGALLSRKQRLLECEECFDLSDRYGYEDPPDVISSGYIEFKDQPQWANAYQQVKKILATREHVPSALEREERRLQQSKKKG